MTAFTIGAIGMCGAPPVAGFISKWFLCLGTIQAGSLIFLSVILTSSLLDVVYFFPVVKTAFFDRPAGSVVGDSAQLTNKEKEQPLFLFMVVPLAITAVFSIIFCFFPQTFYILDLAEMAIVRLMH
jgi:formate hydrogenlyase subunit 3/multisubunit Na+/H+ antiporter MnhD subunit